jgi:ABC-type nitrate/sulfonate/bicarbonate transport system substrate-binding protein
MKNNSISTRTVYKIGFLPLTDSAPLLAAEHEGFFRKHEVAVNLSCEVGWATVREKLTFGELDGAVAVAGLAPALRLGINGPSCPVIAPMVLSLQGNAITLSRHLYNAGVRDAQSLTQYVRGHQNRVLTLGVISKWCSHYFLLREWLASGGLRVDEEVRLVLLPPPLLPDLLASSVIDGFCSGEPWNSAAVIGGHGWVAATTAQLNPGHVEKVLLLNEDTARANQDATSRLLQALREACAWCDETKNRPKVADILHKSGHFSTTLASLRASLVGPFNDGAGQSTSSENFHFFHRHDANTPTAEKALWLLRGLRRHGVVVPDQEAALKDAFAASWGVLSSTAPPSLIKPIKVKKILQPSHANHTN